MVKRQRKNLEDDDPLIDPSAREYIYDEVDEYNELGKENDDDDLGLSDSENEFDGDTRLISKDKREEQVLGLDLDSSDEDYKDDVAGFSDDIENSENEEKDMVENRSLGRRKKDYYGTDITDQRLFNIGRQKTKKKGEEDSLQIEMDGAIAFQKRNLTGKFGFDFDLEPETAGESKGESMEEQLKGKDGEIESKGKKSKPTHKLKKIMHSKFSDIDKLAKEVCEELQAKLIPLIEASKNGVLPESFDTNYLLTRYFLCLNINKTYSFTDEKTMETCKRKYESELDPVLDDLKNGKLKKKRKLLGVVKLKKKDKTVTFEKNKEATRNGDKEEMYSEDGDSFLGLPTKGFSFLLFDISILN
ncbi:hypothetical protein Anas_12877 [Armadillidium nasatum]|uniref:Uncharacterized protein n=1 Tax=Armadillidium nasatum TaxID=96803 RepID=A0A5N5T678_9CRUS|nr:hypothetical protein Anas_12877 [Armadillidium nasatum]